MKKVLIVHNIYCVFPSPGPLYFGPTLFANEGKPTLQWMHQHATTLSLLSTSSPK